MALIQVCAGFTALVLRSAMYLVLLLPSGLSVDIGSPNQSVGPRQEAECSSLLVFPTFPGLSPIKSHTHPWLGQVSGAEAGERCPLVPPTGWWVWVPCAQ